MNPWGKDQYYGPWSDNDSRWTAAYKSQVNLVQNEDDGIFYVPLIDNDGNEIYRNSYRSFSLNMYSTTWKRHLVEVKNTIAQNIKFEV